MKVIEFNHALYIGQNIGTDVLTKEDVKLLEQYGISVKDIETKFTPFEQQYYFGRLAAALGDKNASKLNYNDFKQYLRRGQYIPLNQTEKDTLDIAKQRTYSHIKYLGQKTQQNTSNIILQENQKKRDEFEATIKGSIERAVLERDSINSVVSEIGHKTGDWGRDLGRIADTEMQNVYEEGKAVQIERDAGKDARVYKEVYPAACRFCIKFYTTSGVGSKPVIFKLSTLRSYGSNVGRKQKSWTATLSATHPHCRCNLEHIPKGYIWNEELGVFAPPKVDPNDPKRQRKGIKITVGDKVFNI